MTTTSPDLTRPAGRIDARTLRARHDDVRILDVRTASEFENAHIRGSYHVPLHTLGEHCHDICGVDRDVVVVCQSGARAEQAAAKLAEAGMDNMAILDGGMHAWLEAGGDVERGDERWGLERQVRLVAGSLVVAGVLTSTKIPAAKWLAGCVGGGLTYAALSDTCAMGNVLSRLPYNQADAGDIAATVDALVSNRPAPTA